MMMNHLTRFALLLVLFGLSAVATAQDANVDAAREAFWEGNDAYVDGDYPAAVQAFQEAYNLAPNAQLLEYMGRAYVGMGRYAEAIESFEQFAVEAPDHAESIAETVAGLRADMWSSALGALGSRLDSALAVATGEQPRSQLDARAELGTRMTNVPIQVTSTPRAAEVYIDGVEFGSFGVTPLDTRLFTGPHLIEIRKPFYEPASRVVNVSVPRRGESILVADFELERRQVDCRVTVRPLTARVSHVSEDGTRTDLGTGGWAGTLPAGPGTFIVQNAGRDRRVEMTVDVPEDGSTLEIPLTLSAVASTSITIEVGTLVVVNQVDEGSVRIDGREVGVGLGEFSTDLTPGVHRLVVSRDGYESFEQEVTVTAGSSATLYVNALQRSGRRQR